MTVVKEVLITAHDAREGKIETKRKYITQERDVGRSMQEIADALGVTRQRVQQLVPGGDIREERKLARIEQNKERAAEIDKRLEQSPLTPSEIVEQFDIGSRTKFHTEVAPYLTRRSAVLQEKVSESASRAEYTDADIKRSLREAWADAKESGEWYLSSSWYGEWAKTHEGAASTPLVTNRFGEWSQATKAARVPSGPKLRRRYRRTSTDDLLADLRAFYAQTQADNVRPTVARYEQFAQSPEGVARGAHSASLIRNRLRHDLGIMGWAAAIQASQDQS